MTRSGHAFFVGAGILASRLVGFLRQRTLNHFFGGHSDAADAFYAAFKIPNLLQNLFGEGALSGSFIPVYARLLADGETNKANETARAILGILSLVIGILVALGIAVTPLLISLIAPGFTGEKRELTISLVRIFFPGAGILVISAWCLGVLNSHRKFFLSYSAPVIWNLAIIGALLVGMYRSEAQLAMFAAWGSVIGSLAQVVIQLPAVIRIMGSTRPRFDRSLPEVRTVIKNFIPTAGVRGVGQISAYIDQIIASLLPTGAITGLTNAQLIYTLPVSLFGMSIAASELPELSRMTESASHQIETRLKNGCRQLCFTIIPTIGAFLFLGDIIAGAIYQTGAFSAASVRYVWYILCGSTIGLLAGTQARLLSSALYALRDPRTPLRYAIVRVTVASVAGFVCATSIPSVLGLNPLWGAVGLSGASGCAGWLEYSLLKSHLRRKLGITPHIERRFLSAVTISALASGLFCYLTKGWVSEFHPIVAAICILPVFGGIFMCSTLVMKIPEASSLIRRLRLGRLIAISSHFISSRRNPKR
jgi:putative peptidoglycan lipid II flippase